MQINLLIWFFPWIIIIKEFSYQKIRVIRSIILFIDVIWLIIIGYFVFIRECKFTTAIQMVFVPEVLSKLSFRFIKEPWAISCTFCRTNTIINTWQYKVDLSENSNYMFLNRFEIVLWALECSFVTIVLFRRMPQFYFFTRGNCS